MPTTTTPAPTPSTALAPAPPVPTTVPPLEHELRHGMVEDKVKTLQERLQVVQFDPGPIDGVFGDATLRAVWAFEKLHLAVPRADVSGVVTADVWHQMYEAPVAAARRAPGGNHAEVYLPEQVAIVFSDGAPTVITHVSTGAGDDWCDEVTVDEDDGTTTTKGICGRAVTPGGVYHVERKVDGWRNAPLGRLYKPIYFNYGIAIHGATNVPDSPASRGCVRVPLHVADYLPSLLDVGDAVFVFDGVAEPEQYGAQLPVFDRPDPDYVATTTTTTTTTTLTPSPAPVSTVAPTNPDAAPGITIG